MPTAKETAMTLIETEEQHMLRYMLRRFLAETCDSCPAGTTPPALWPGLAELGALTLTLDEAQGGSGCGTAELAVVLSELGRTGTTVPYVSCVVRAAGLIQAAGSPAQQQAVLPEVGAGRLMLAAADGLSGPDRITASGTALTGRARGLAPGAARIVVAARDGYGAAGLYLVDTAAPGVALQQGIGPDGSANDSLTLSAAPAELIASGAVATAALAEVEDRSTTCLLAEAVGAMDAMLGLTVDHLNTRQQFGRALSTFQVLQHRVAEMFVEIEMARSMLIHAVAMAPPDADPVVRRAAVAAAQLRICTAIRHVGPEAIQLHGGMGMAWEHRVGHLFKRTTAIDLALGGDSAALDRLADAPALLTA